MVSFILPGNSATGGYEVANSLIFEGGDSASLIRTPSSATNQKTFTFSTWVKRITSGSDYILSAKTGTGSSDNFYFGWRNDQIQITSQSADGNTTNVNIRSNALFRDFSAWYHLVCAIDTTQGTSTDRVKLYVNGSQVTSLENTTYPSENDDLYGINGTVEHAFGRENYSGGAHYHSYYLAETVLIDGSQLDPTSFGEFDEDSPTIWKPIDVSGLTFGTNGFYLDFEDSSSLGNDAAGSNNFTANNLAATDQSTDTCTNNFATMNPLVNSAITYSEGNLHYKNTHGSNSEFTLATIQEVSNGRWYWEIKMASTNNNSAYEYFGNGTAYVKSNGDIYPSGTTTVSNGDIFGFYLNYEDGQMTIHRNGSQVYQSSSGISLSTTTAQIAAFNNTEYQVNFGNPIFSISSGNADANGYGNFEYSPALSGVNFYSLNTKNLAEFG